jgi:hypothetical protein
LTDRELALQAAGDTQRVLQQYLPLRRQNNERRIPGLSLEVLERPDLIVAKALGCDEVTFELLP